MSTPIAAAAVSLPAKKPPKSLSAVWNMIEGLASVLKWEAIFQIRFPHFRSLILRMSLSQNRCTLLRDMP
ncbi:hypothetical protein [Rhizobium sp. No.120]